MALFDMAKNFLSPISVEIECPGSFSGHDSAISGQIKLTAKGEPQQVQEVVIVLVERIHQNGTTDDHVRGNAYVCRQPFTVESGQVKTFDFQLPIQIYIPRSGLRVALDEGGVLGAIGVAGIVAATLLGSDDDTSTSSDDSSSSDDSTSSDDSSSHSTYELVAAADVLGCKFDPKCTRSITRWDGLRSFLP